MSAASPDMTARILRHMEDLPPLSPTVTKVLQIVNNPDASANDLIQVIKLDPVLTAKVLRLINSPFFGMSNVTSVGRALVAVGFNTVKNLVLSSALAGLLSAGSNDEAEQLWGHSLAVGVAARMLARAGGHRREQQEAAFIAGLMHDLGKILINKHLQVELKQIRALEAQGRSETDAEKAVLGMTHEHIGGLLGRKWLFPPTLLAGVEAHHVPRLEGEGFLESCLTYVANLMFYRMALGEHRPHVLPTLEPAVWKIIGLSEAEALELLAAVPEEVEAAKAFLGR